MKKYIPLTIGLLVTALLLIFVVNQGRAQQTSPASDRQSAPNDTASKSDFLPIQGRLTDANGNPLNGPQTITFRLYGGSGSLALCENTVTTNVINGLFSTYMYAGDCPIDGRQLLLGIQVGTDPEMTPRSFIDNVPYAWSLRPGAIISYTLHNNALLHIENWSDTGRGLRAYAMSTTGENFGIVGASRSPDGYGGYFYNNANGIGLAGSDTGDTGGIGLYGDSLNGVAIGAGGTGIITSTAKSSVWISGNGVRPYLHSDSTYVDMDTVGGAKVYRGADAGLKNVMLPIAIPGVLYGENVKVTGLDLYWSGDTNLDAITAILLRRQTGVCSGASCYATILFDTADHACFEDDFPTGCVLHYDLANNNELSTDSGSLYLTIEMGFSGASTWIDIGGVKLTLEHDD